MILGLAWKSLCNRRTGAVLTVLSIALSVALLLAVERIRAQSRDSFTASVSGTDLIAGARTSPLHLLLYSVFHVGNATSNIGWASYREIAARPEVSWIIPLSFGDTHRRYRVIGSTVELFEHFRYGRDRRLTFATGSAFAAEDEAVLGAEVAAALGYSVGSEIVLSHGAGEVGFVDHAEHPVRVRGILARSGTPMDRAVFVSLDAIAEIHAEQGEPEFDPLAQALREHERAGDEHRHEQHAVSGLGAGAGKHPPDSAAPAVSALLIGLKQRSAALALQRAINEMPQEALIAILPGATLLELWDMLGTLERTLMLVSVLVVAVGLAGMVVALLAGLHERRREMAVLRSVGARPAQILALILGEATLITAAGIVLGLVLLYAAQFGASTWLEQRLGLYLTLHAPSAAEWLLMACVLAAGVLVALIPALRSYRQSLADGMTIRV